MGVVVSAKNEKVNEMKTKIYECNTVFQYTSKKGVVWCFIQILVKT